MTMKNSFVSAVAAPVAALALMAAPQKADATTYQFEAFGIVNSETDFSDIVGGSVLAPGSSFYFSGIYDSSLAPLSGIPGISQTYLLSDINFSLGSVSGSADPGRFRVLNDHPSNGDQVIASFSSTTPAISILTSGLDVGTDMSGAQFVISLPSTTWGTTDGDAPYLSGALPSASGTARFDFNNSSGGIANFEGSISRVSMTMIPPTGVPEVNPTVLLMLMSFGGLGAFGYRTMRGKKEASPAPAPTTLG